MRHKAESNMEKREPDEVARRRFPRRKFIGEFGAATAGLLIAPYLRLEGLFAYAHESEISRESQVALTQADNYTRSFVKQRVQHLLESLGGIGDIVKAGDKVAIKINLTGGGGDAIHMWTHPEVLRAVGELLIDAGVSGSNIYIVEALWSTASFNNYGYSEVKQSLGAQLIDLNATAPYADFATLDVGSNSSYYSSFAVNGVLKDVDVYVSIPKMKQHYEAGVTASLKNQVGMVPKQRYTSPTNSGRRDALHTKDGTQSSTTHLPRSICDLNFARPVHLAVIDGIKNARGGEGTWNPTFKPWEDHVLLAGKDPVATDSIAAFLMGNDPEAATLQLPDGGRCDNYLAILHLKGMGTNQLSEIKAVGDGAGLVTSVQPRYEAATPESIELYPNYPNPFNPSTMFSFYLPVAEHVTIRIISVTGQEIATLVDGRVAQGVHQLQWSPSGIASGVYFCEMRAGGFVTRRKMIYQK